MPFYPFGTQSASTLQNSVRHQMVRTTPDPRMARSAVTNGRPSIMAVAPMIRSAGSLGYDAGSAAARAQAFAVMGRTRNLDSSSSRKDSRLVSKRSFFLLAIIASSSSVISQIAKPEPVVRALSIAAWAFDDTWAGSPASHRTTCVSSRIKQDFPSPPEEEETRCPQG